MKNVAVTVIHKKDVINYYEAAGTVQSKTISVISSRITGTVTDVLIKQGDKVAATFLSRTMVPVLYFMVKRKKMSELFYGIIRG